LYGMRGSWRRHALSRVHANNDITEIYMCCHYASLLGKALTCAVPLFLSHGLRLSHRRYACYL
jgi:hypothetical protein